MGRNGGFSLGVGAGVGVFGFLTVLTQLRHNISTYFHKTPFH